MAEKIKKEKIFLNAMDSWFSNFLIETFRTDHLPDSKLQNEFINYANQNGYYATVAFGAQNAIDIIESYIKCR